MYISGNVFDYGTVNAQITLIPYFTNLENVWIKTLSWSCSTAYSLTIWDVMETPGLKLRISTALQRKARSSRTPMRKVFPLCPCATPCTPAVSPFPDQDGCRWPKKIPPSPICAGAVRLTRLSYLTAPCTACLSSATPAALIRSGSRMGMRRMTTSMKRIRCCSIIPWIMWMRTATKVTLPRLTKKLPSTRSMKSPTTCASASSG